MHCNWPMAAPRVFHSAFPGSPFYNGWQRASASDEPSRSVHFKANFAPSRSLTAQLHRFRYQVRRLGQAVRHFVALGGWIFSGTARHLREQSFRLEATLEYAGRCTCEVRRPTTTSVGSSSSTESYAGGGRALDLGNAACRYVLASDGRREILCLRMNGDFVDDSADPLDAPHRLLGLLLFEKRRDPPV